MKNNNQSTEVIEVDAEEMLPEIQLEKVIENTLVKANVTDQVIADLKEKYGNMKLANIEDKETYLDIKEARKVVRKVGIITEKLCKKGREDAVAIQRKWLSKEKEILGKIAEVENPLNDEIEKFDNEVERKEIAEQKRQEEIYINRQSTLSKMGAIYDNGSFVLNHISYEVELLKSADNDMWNDTILPKYRKVFEEIEAVKVAEENKRKEELAQQKKEREEFEAQQKKFKEDQELFAKQQSDLQKQKDEVERQQRVEQERKDAEIRIKQRELIDNRAKQLQSLGMSFSFAYDAYVFEDVNINNSEISLLSNEEWDSLMEEISPAITAKRKVLEEENIAKLEKEKQAAIELAAKQEREKIVEEQRQAELKKQQDEQRRQEQLAQSNDKTKWEYFLLQLGSIPFPTDFKSSIYKSKLSIAKEKISEINDL